MFGRFSRQYWKKNNSRTTSGRKSALGGEIKSMEEIAELTQKIADHEKQESHAADAMLESAWETVEKKRKS